MLSPPNQQSLQEQMEAHQRMLAFAQPAFTIWVSKHHRQRRRQLQIEERIAEGMGSEGDEPEPASIVKVQKKPSTKTSQKTSQKKPATVPKQPLQKTSPKKPTSVPKQPLQKTCQKKPGSVVKQQLQKKLTPKERKRIQNKVMLFRPIIRLAAEFKKRFISME